jgi:hypothetical protein
LALSGLEPDDRGVAERQILDESFALTPSVSLVTSNWVEGPDGPPTAADLAPIFTCRITQASNWSAALSFTWPTAVAHSFAPGAIL